jgi:hypothetical protein
MIRTALFVLVLAVVVGVFTSPLHAALWASDLSYYMPGEPQESPIGSGAYYTNPHLALGPVSPLASREVPSTDVVQLGQGGSIVLSFDGPILNKIPDPASSNPLGYDFVIFGNAFEAGFVGSGIFFREPGYVEVARRGADDRPGEWFLLLPDKWPADLVGGLDSGPGALFSGYADVSPVRGDGNPLLPPDHPDSAGGDGFFLERAVRQLAPGVPRLDDQGQPIFVTLNSVDFIRITDAILNDGGPTGFYTTDIDAAINLPGTVPEPSAMLPLIAAAVIGLRRWRPSTSGRP